MQELDKIGKLIIQKQSGAVLRLAGLGDLERWKAVHSEPILAHELPDGLIEAHERGSDRPILALVEISKYAYSRLPGQLAKGAILVSALRGEVPEVIALVLFPRGKKSAPLELELTSAEGTSGIRVRWRVVELWKVPAEELLATGDVGLVPFLPLTAFEGSTGAILQECRKRIQRDAPPEMRGELLIATHYLAGLQYNDRRLFQRLGGIKAMLDTKSPYLLEVFERVKRKGLREGRKEGRKEGLREGRNEGLREGLREGRNEGLREGRNEGRREAAETAIMTVLQVRFGEEARALSADLKAVSDARLESIVAIAATCPDLAAFRSQIARRQRKGSSEDQ